MHEMKVGGHPLSPNASELLAGRFGCYFRHKFNDLGILTLGGAKTSHMRDPNYCVKLGEASSL